ncbi:response regulator [Herbiconiux sp. SYSU D00978]|uniref:response regulator n=1 Tax=Herbiconiux sp. SYSU D00978 TaxID=2812562 RepID=UPI001A95E1C4|nr:response regulator transcription factor [Herbiconiux sp. SYSU D00978]
MTTVFLVDDHEIVRRGLADLIDAEADLEVIGEAGTAKQALSRISATTPDVAVLDVQLPDGSGIDVCRDIRSTHPEVKCLILTAYDDDRATYAAVLAGASGYVLKNIRGQGLLDSIRAVAAGRTLIDPSSVKKIQDHAETPEVYAQLDLTPRERQVLGLIADGLTNRQIGDQLELAEKTVKNYVSGLLAKLGMERRTQAAVYGAKLRDE